MRDYFTNTLAIGAVATPAWYPSLEDVSTQAALWLPILGAAWLIIQIWSKLYRDK